MKVGKKGVGGRRRFEDKKEKEKKLMLSQWCGHCKRLAPDYEVVANAFAGDDHVVVAKIDCDAQKEKCGAYDVSGYPTLKWFPKDNKEGEKYEGARDIDAFVTFINNKAGTQRDKAGALGALAGRIPSLDDIVAKFIAEKADKVRYYSRGRRGKGRGKWKEGLKINKLYRQHWSRRLKSTSRLPSETPSPTPSTTSKSLLLPSLNRYPSPSLFFLSPCRIFKAFHSLLPPRQPLPLYLYSCRTL
jgi:protein disulfide-isomerase-like protein